MGGLAQPGPVVSRWRNEKLTFNEQTLNYFECLSTRIKIYSSLDG